jgi:hypothetical protein
MAKKDETLLSDVLPPWASDLENEDVSDALCLWGQASGKVPVWLRPDNPLAISTFDAEHLKASAYGLRALCEVQVMLGAMTETVSPNLMCGLQAAAFALARGIEDGLSRAETAANRVAKKNGV